MSNFVCPKCGTVLYDTPRGYVTGCEHFPADAIAPECASSHRALSSSGKTADADEPRNVVFESH